jgi:hypothetical protein
MKSYIYPMTFIFALLCTTPSIAADSQTTLAIRQSEAAQQSFQHGELEQGRQHLLAAESHTEVALRHQVGAKKKDLKISLSQIKEATEQAQKGHMANASAAAGIALEKLLAVDGR